MKKSIQSISLLITCSLILFTSCDLELKTPAIEEESAEESGLATRVASDIIMSIDNIIMNSLSNKTKTNCPLIDDTNDGTTRTIIITYPEGGCPGDLVVMEGIINITSPINISNGNTAVITFNNFSIDGNQLKGEMDVALTQILPNPVLSVEMNNMELKISTDEKVSWNANKSFTLMEGYSGISLPFNHEDIDWPNTVWKISGSSYGTTSQDDTFSTTETNLLTSKDCKWFDGGTISGNINEEEFTITFSEDNCGSVNISSHGISFGVTFD